MVLFVVFGFGFCFLFCCVSVCLFFFSVVLKVLCVVGLLYGKYMEIAQVFLIESDNLTNFKRFCSILHAYERRYNFIKITSSKIQFGRFPYRVCSDKVLRIIHYDV